LLVAGVDQEGGHVLAADMSGAVTEEDFASSGSGSPIAYGVLESVYNKDVTNEQAKQIATKAVAAAMERDPGSGNGIDVLAIPNLLLVQKENKGVSR
jgi:proteasome beta subunit